MLWINEMIEVFEERGNSRENMNYDCLKNCNKTLSNVQGTSYSCEESVY